VKRWLIGLSLGCGGSDKPVDQPVEPTQRTTRVPVEESEPDDGVEVISSRGHMEPAVVEAGIRPHAGELSDCYTTRVGKRRWLGGHVSLHWEIQRDGAVTSVRLAESDLGAWPVEKCLLEVARAATFGKPVGGNADFAIPLDFTSRGKVELWDEDRTLKAIGGQLAGLDECAKQKGVKGAPKDVAVTLYVGPQGKAQSVGFASAKSVIDDTWADCAETVALAWRLPDPRGTVGKLAIRYH
jgi:hypothetical protein